MTLENETSKAKDTVAIGAAAEYYVMCQLLRRNFIAALAPKGVPEIDILVTDRGGNSLAEVQVKGRQYSRDRGWMMGEKHEKLIRPRLFYCMVDFGEGLADIPKCWILHPQDEPAVELAFARLGAVPGQGGGQLHPCPPICAGKSEERRGRFGTKFPAPLPLSTCVCGPVMATSCHRYGERASGFHRLNWPLAPA